MLDRSNGLVLLKALSAAARKAETLSHEEARDLLLWAAVYVSQSLVSKRDPNDPPQLS